MGFVILVDSFLFSLLVLKFDEEGIVSYERESNVKGLHTIWKRGQISKAEKSKERHEKALAKH